jgi:hypothetical protein
LFSEGDLDRFEGADAVDFKTLRGWRPTFTGATEEELMLVIQKMELKAA